MKKLCILITVSFLFPQVLLGAQDVVLEAINTAVALSPSPSLSPVALSPSPTSPSPPTPPDVLPSDSSFLIGMRLAEAWVTYGPPLEAFPLRGEEAWQDDVVFRYAPGYSFFWYGDRLWQIRFHNGYSGPVYGLFLGDSEEKLISSLGQPFAEIEGSRLFRLPFRGFELRLRAVVREGRVADLYVYRADF